jgi:hypothetical protein
LSRGSNPCGYPHKPLVSYRINRQLSGWIPPPLMIRAFGAHCQERTYAAQQNNILFDHLVGEREQRRRHGEAEHPGGLGVELDPPADEKRVPTDEEGVGSLACKACENCNRDRKRDRAGCGTRPQRPRSMATRLRRFLTSAETMPP